MSEITEAGMRILQAVARGELAWSEPEALGEAAGLERESALDTMADLHVEGWLDVWESPEGIRVTLTPRAASQLGVSLVEHGPRLQPRWSGAGAPPRSIAFRRSGLRSGVPGSSPERLDPLAPPDEAVEHFESVSRHEGPAGARPVLLLGQRLCPWPGPEQVDPAAPCPGCGGAKLAPDEYCLRCDEWGGSDVDAAHPAARHTRNDPDHENPRSRRVARRSRRLVPRRLRHSQGRSRDV
jgi:hypothetical protein